MVNFHGDKKRSSFFEGWYFKHQANENTIAFIPGINIDDTGHRAAFVQIITNTDSYHIPYNISEFKADKKILYIKIGNNIFSENGVKIDIQNESISCKGSIAYEFLTPLKSNIMGPFRLIPFMECNHGIISLHHKLKGELTLNNQQIYLSGGTGYIEKDWGCSFPKNYTWVQSNNFGNEKCCVVACAANIPFLGMHFPGCTCAIYYKNKEYRLATYYGAKIRECDSGGLTITQGKYTLSVSFQEKSPQKLFAPSLGSMSRNIHENACCTAKFSFMQGGVPIFESVSPYTSFEFVE